MYMYLHNKIKLMGIMHGQASNDLMHVFSDLEYFYAAHINQSKWYIPKLFCMQIIQNISYINIITSYNNRTMHYLMT